MATSKKTQRKTTRTTTTKRPRTGRISVRREESARRVASSARTAAVRQRIDDALKEGQRLRLDIEAKIDRGLRSRLHRHRGTRR